MWWQKNWVNMRARLGVNIDHVATLRQQRGESYPSIIRATELSLENGADQITIHLREDRRHIQDRDVPVVHEICRRFKRPLNLEMGCASEMIRIACLQKPEWVCLVPEKREERTTEGGLAMIDSQTMARVSAAVKEIRQNTPETKISLFVEAQEDVLAACLTLDIQAVEIHTGDYARDYQMGSGIGFHAGHGLTDQSVRPLVTAGLFAEYNIGHWIISEALFRGLGPVVADLKKIICP
jgi:pyridoxine 5-phosphate synthase